MDSDNNYEYYRKAFEVQKGLPFLLPHIRHLKFMTQNILSGFHPSKDGEYKIWLDRGRAQLLEDQAASSDKGQSSWITCAMSCLAARRNKITPRNNSTYAS